MRTRTAAALTAATLLALTLTGCSSDTADSAACKTAMAKQLAAATAAGDQAKPGTRPEACDGVDDQTLQRITGELISDQVDKAVDDATESAAPDPAAGPVSDECRAWIKAELLDSSDSIDGVTGNGVCGDLSDEEMDQAIEDVTNELTAAP
ncbi:hypothetical protein [Streptomyces sp. NPDC001876]|uniref:hypothetical protein n=1 Tax=Streptomyces sp. NPDC001876 TaxID=3154402 RepID=UPI0033234319